MLKTNIETTSSSGEGAMQQTSSGEVQLRSVNIDIYIFLFKGMHKGENIYYIIIIKKQTKMRKIHER